MCVLNDGSAVSSFYGTQTKRKYHHTPTSYETLPVKYTNSQTRQKHYPERLAQLSIRLLPFVNSLE